MIRSRRVVVAGIFSLAVLSPCLQAAAQGKKYRFGFSQVTTLEPWRVQFNKDMRAEAAKHPQVELVIADAGDRTDKQVADMDNFIAQKMDVIFISPKESAGLTGVVEMPPKPGSQFSFWTETSTATALRSTLAATTWRSGEQQASTSSKPLAGSARHRVT